jgi:hypothetical protein
MYILHVHIQKYENTNENENTHKQWISTWILEELAILEELSGQWSGSLLRLQS